MRGWSWFRTVRRPTSLRPSRSWERARLDLDAYTMSQRVIAWFTPDDCVVLEQ
jgi:hypothetical protein